MTATVTLLRPRTGCPGCGGEHAHFELGRFRWNFCCHCQVKWRAPRATPPPADEASELREAVNAFPDLQRAFAFAVVPVPARRSARR